MNKVRRVLAIIGLALIALMYILTIIFALMQSPNSKNLLMAAIFCTIAVPVLLYAIQLVAKVLPKFGPKGNEMDDVESSDAYDELEDSEQSDK